MGRYGPGHEASPHAVARAGPGALRLCHRAPGARRPVARRSVRRDQTAETPWLLIKNPRFRDVPSEPEDIWGEEDKIPFTFKGLINQNALIAPPEIVAK